MKRVKKTLLVLVLILVSLMIISAGCKKEEPADTGAAVVAESVELCAMCGQVKGSELCCKPGQEKCEKCGLVKGSPGCCKIPKI